MNQELRSCIDNNKITQSLIACNKVLIFINYTSYVYYVILYISKRMYLLSYICLKISVIIFATESILPLQQWQAECPSRHYLMIYLKEM